MNTQLPTNVEYKHWQHLDAFVEIPYPRNGWFRVNCYQIYLRKSMRKFDDDILKCLDIANVHYDAYYNKTPGNRAFGTYYFVIRDLIDRYSRNFDAFYVESLLNPALMPLYTRLGFKQIITEFNLIDTPINLIRLTKTKDCTK